MNDLASTQDAGGSLDLLLSAATADGRARQAALRAIGPGLHQAASMVIYRSAGHVLVIGNEGDAVPAAKELKDRLRCTVLIVGDKPESRGGQIGKLHSVNGMTLVQAKLLELTGYLGEFRARVATADGEANLASFVGAGQDHFDLVLDLTSPAFIRHEILPPGYYAPGTDREARQRALTEIPEMVGEFEKPKYFHYNPDICAHGASGLKGCTRCLEVCPTLAITSVGDKISVDPHLCQGGGSCATACPTGAITYAYPPVRDLLDGVRTVLKTYREAGGKHPALLFHDRESGKQTVAHLASRLAERIIPFEIEEVGAVGMDAWLAALAYGARGVALLASPAVAPSVIRELRTQLEYAAAILEGMGYSREQLQLITAADETGVLEVLNRRPPPAEFRAATFAAMQEKRTTLRLAVDHLYSQAPRVKRVVPLPAGAPFGEIKVNRATCTLCMACVGVCPASALSDGADLPQLIFREWNCVQCGLCDTACPEDAITLAPRFLYDPELRTQTRILNEQQPFCCTVCGKPFATQAMMDRMTEKLKGHWMFQSPEALQRLQMCEDCRVKDMFRHKGGLADAYRKP
jgi:ferredoxin